MMSKDEASDLKSHIDRLVSCELACLRAALARDDAAGRLANFTYGLQHPAKAAV